MVIGDRSFVLNRKNEVLCFVAVTKFELREKASFVLNRNWRFWRQAARRRTAWSAGGKALDRSRAVLDIFTNSSCTCAARNAKRCVCTFCFAAPAVRHPTQNNPRRGKISAISPAAYTCFAWPTTKKQFPFTTDPISPDPSQ